MIHEVYLHWIVPVAELKIDEQSPDEDDQRALAALPQPENNYNQGQSLAAFQHNLIVPAGHIYRRNRAPTDFTVLKAYWHKNGKTHAPEPLSLHHSHAAQRRNHIQYSRHATQDLEANKPVDDEDEEEDNNTANDGTPPVQSRATCHSRIEKARGPKETQTWGR